MTASKQLPIRKDQTKMRNIHTDLLIQNLKEMCIEANLELTDDVSSRIIYASKNEGSELGKKILEQLVTI